MSVLPVDPVLADFADLPPVSDRPEEVKREGEAGPVGGDLWGGGGHVGADLGCRFGIVCGGSSGGVSRILLLGLT